MQQELIDRIKNTAGVSDETAGLAAKAVLGFLQEKLPDSVAPHVASVMSGQSLTDSIQDSVTDAIGDKLGGLGSMFGGDD